ncbi:MAG: hypothetical protein CMI16_13375 [Opitutaceae bacterium]|nr:hypothetical protein [Opitutaceae bacterium]|tara:strand:- start:3287 stop:3664 length:378 start_codon:yes stop_codon:yes gene_type:complete
MLTQPSTPAQLRIPFALADLLAESAELIAKESVKAYRIVKNSRRADRGQTLHPGKQTPLWNALRAELRLHLLKYGAQANLGRLLGLPRQRINAFVTGGGQMPDAERTLQLLAWLMAEQKKAPAKK